MNNWEKFLVEMNNIANEYDIDLDDCELSADYTDENGEIQKGSINTGDHTAFNALSSRSRSDLLQSKEWSILS